ncbi:hypothetical protein [Paenibacillus brasilensis]|uniref:YqzN/YkzM domain-containing protein n=1 Tax=Paenibacillus brasilensis TaxID=128574 RepID=A0ABU0KWT8_9BACL|nr:hypothetical protein [Paenibacillus brasilensis]MDQ0493907.1 hypothetical protein [Paenibacillus brasilensis]
MTFEKNENSPIYAGQEVGGPRYTLEELKEHAEPLFSVKEEVLAGAFFGEQDKLFTVAEAHTKIEQFMKAKVD